MLSITLPPDFSHGDLLADTLTAAGYPNVSVHVEDERLVIAADWGDGGPDRAAVEAIVEAHQPPPFDHDAALYAGAVAEVRELVDQLGEDDSPTARLVTMLADLVVPASLSDSPPADG